MSRIAGADAASEGTTIVAHCTPPGRSALAMIRLSGPDSAAIGRQLLHPAPAEPRRATHCELRDPSGQRIDDCVATLYRAPASFTGEDLLEITTHGGTVIAPLAVAAAITAGAQAAEPGAFTRRAVLNRKLDLLQAEAVGDLIDARTSAAHRMALRQLDGALSRLIDEVRSSMLALEAMLVYDIDFPEEDDGPISRERIAAAARGAIAVLAHLLTTSTRGTLVQDGALVVLAGAPNAGKSSLFNAVLGDVRAIVTDIPGTTRDAIEVLLDLGQWPIRLVDTAGLRDEPGVIEQKGIETAWRYLQHADVILACTDGAESEATLRASLPQNARADVILVQTKCDLLPDSARREDDAVWVSSAEGTGLEALLHRISGALSDRHHLAEDDSPVLTRARHVAGIERAHAELERFLTLWNEESVPAAFAATHIRTATAALADVVGTVVTDDILDVVFQQFCVGK